MSEKAKFTALLIWNGAIAHAQRKYAQKRLLSSKDYTFHHLATAM